MLIVYVRVCNYAYWLLYSAENSTETVWMCAFMCVCVCVCVWIGHLIVRKILREQFSLQSSVVQRILRKYFNSTETILFIVNYSIAKTQMPQFEVFSSK